MLSVLPGLKRRSFDMVVAAPSSGPLADELRRLDVEHHPFCVRDSLGKRRDQQSLRDDIRRLAVETDASIVHANSVAMGRLSGPVFQESDVPHLVHMRDILRLSAQAIRDLNGHVRILTVSEATRQWYVRFGLDNHKTYVSHNGVDLDRFQPAASNGYLHDELGLDRSTPLVGAIGQIGMRKGTDLFLEAAARIADRSSQAHFVLIGRRFSGKDEAIRFEKSIHQAAVRSNLNGRVHLLGVRNDIHRLLNELALLVHAARQEPLGRVLLEAAAAGCPVIATDVGGTREIFGSTGRTGLLVPPGDSQSLCKAVAELLGDKKRRASIGRFARQRAVARFGVESAVGRIYGHYEALLAGIQTRRTL